MAQLQDVFKTGGVPTITFVKPLEYPKLILNLRTPGRGLVIEGPSGIGKTTAVLKAIEECGLSNKITKLNDDKRMLIADRKTSTELKTLSTSFEGVKYAIWKRLSDKFYEICKSFALGARYRPEGRAPYLHLLNWLAESGQWVLNLSDVLRTHPGMRLSVNQVIEKKYLDDLF
jgi:hypothetical protein